MVGTVTLERFSELVGSVYEAATDLSRWPRFLDSFGQTVGAGAVAIFMHDFATSESRVEDGGTALAAHSGFDPAFIQSMTDYYHKTNVWAQNEAMLREGVAVTGGMLYPNEALPKTEWYGDWLRPQGFFYAIGGIVAQDGTLAVKFTALRTRHAGEYGAQEIALCTVLMPHVRRACTLYRRLAQITMARDAALEMLDRLEFGVVFLDSYGRGIHANAFARALASGGDGFKLDRGGHCSAGMASETAELRRLIGAAVRTGVGAGMHSGGALQLTRSRSIRPLSVLVSPVRLADNLPRLGTTAVPAAVVFVSDPDTKIRTPAQMLASLYGLSPAEGRLAAALVAGEQLWEYASARGIAKSTAITQVKRVMSKMDARRQSDVVRIVLSGPASMGTRR